MIIGVPKEIKDNEYPGRPDPGRGAPVGGRGASGAGAGRRRRRQRLPRRGVCRSPARPSCATAAEAWAADMVMKVKEPRPAEYGFLRPGLILFTYLHLAADEEQTQALLKSKVHGRGLRDGAAGRRLAAAADAHERGGRAHGRAGGRALPGEDERRPRQAAGRRARASRRATWSSSAAAWWAPTRPRSPWAWAPRSPSSTRTSTACAT